MPYNSTASQIIYLTNTGTQTGDISVKANDSDGNVYDLGVVATSTAGEIIKLTSKIYTALTTKVLAVVN